MIRLMISINQQKTRERERFTLFVQRFTHACTRRSNNVATQRPRKKWREILRNQTTHSSMELGRRRSRTSPGCRVICVRADCNGRRRATRNIMSLRTPAKIMVTTGRGFVYAGLVKLKLSRAVPRDCCAQQSVDKGDRVKNDELVIFFSFSSSSPPLPFLPLLPFFPPPRRSSPSISFVIPIRWKKEIADAGISRFIRYSNER